MPLGDLRALAARRFLRCFLRGWLWGLSLLRSVRDELVLGNAAVVEAGKRCNRGVCCWEVCDRLWLFLCW